MDFSSLAVGFLVGTLTGASSTYLGNKYTDIRRKKEQDKEDRKMLTTLERKYPELIAEMKEDFSNPTHRLVRKFAIKSSRTNLNVGMRVFEYHYDKHPDISNALDYMKNLGLIEEVFKEGCPMYRYKEKFADYLIGTKTNQ
ncbi:MULTISPECIES: hypothetical protein [Vibrio]|uniref:hypothetical protein n=1 Tax=Vibrio TaxID=662 RepID=UPI000C83E7DA|nr:MULTISPECIES: hypothetical protein [Vibrio]PMI46080.1 hypothetical protein BCU44_09770 [Vibrio cyclitrophicus]PMP37986.1 hypothetical protein BCS86_22030 [Vibrio splendidus]